MRLPFTHDQFLDVFAAYHRLLWPVAALLWLLTLGAVFHLWRAGPRAGRLVATVLTPEAAQGISRHGLFGRPTGDWGAEQ